MASDAGAVIGAYAMIAATHTAVPNAAIGAVQSSGCPSTVESCSDNSPERCLLLLPVGSVSSNPNPTKRSTI